MLLINFVKALFLVLIAAAILAVGFLGVGIVITAISSVVIVTIGLTLNDIADEWLVELFNRKT